MTAEAESVSKRVSDACSGAVETQYKLYLFHVLPVATPWGFMGMKRGSFHCFSRGECAALWTRHLYFDLWELDDCHQHFFLLNFLYSDPGE